jgi:predicted GTPase
MKTVDYKSTQNLHHVHWSTQPSELLRSWKDQMEQVGDRTRVQKLEQLLRKVENKEFVLTFAGHFSAGKSSLINELVGEDILPSSPIPTSANVVTIRSGEPEVEIRRLNGESHILPFNDNWDEIRSFAKNGAEIESLQIRYPLPWPDSVSLMDTPGIDSTDDAHKLSTESALHLADIIFYTMDYNHVQSELNFHFVKGLQDRGKRVALIINQIDKHQMGELSFDAYREGVEEAFAAWQVEPLAIFYTTLKVRNHKENGLEALRAAMKQWTDSPETLIQASLYYSLTHLIEEHVEWKKNAQEEQRESLTVKLNELTDDPISAVQKAKERQEHLVQLEDRPQRLENEFKSEMDTLIQNANLTPFEIRDLAEKFLESEKPGFKVGFLFSGQKTAEEKAKRLEAFHSAFVKGAEAHLGWHLREALIRWHEEQGDVNEDYIASIHQWSVPITSELLRAEIHHGALSSMSGQYLLQYTKDLAQTVRNEYRRSALELMEKGLKLVREADAPRLESEKRSAAVDLKILRVMDALDELDQALTTTRESLAEELQSSVKPVIPTSHSKLDGVTQASTQGSAQGLSASSSNGNTSPTARYSIDWEVGDKEVQGTDAVTASPYQKKLADASQRLQKAAQLTSSLPGLKSIGETLIERAERLGNNRFTVALFGAFSAGKSSFANALMGNRVLPVSPNPTTATINQVLPPDEGHPHGTVIVKLKNRDELTKDLAHSLRMFGKESPSLEEALIDIESLREDDWSPSTKPHFSFLRAVQTSISDVSHLLGEEIHVTADEFQAYVAEERKAAFVEWIRLYYHCPMTAHGITLVDTPGADSINARHTGVAFEYIKNADAVLFVTYYNHAFSHADRNFLNQLGRVKDTFEMDKMFFIVNAADLARDHEELHGVIEHVRDNLLKHGIRQPRIHPVSSRFGLWSKMGPKGIMEESALQSVRDYLSLDENEPISWPLLADHSGLPAMEKDFYRFSVEDLTEVALSAASRDVNRVIERLDGMIRSTRQGEQERQAQKQVAEERLHFVDSYKLDPENTLLALEKENAELLFYVKKRIMDRFNEFFSYAFNPATLKEDSGSIKKALSQAADEWQQSIGYELSQESRATVLRLERFIRDQLRKQYNRGEESLQRLLAADTFALPEYEPPTPETPQIDSSLPSGDEKKLQKALQRFKNPRHFFEQEGNVEMRNDLQDWLQPVMAAYIEQIQEQFSRYYREQYLHEHHRVESKIREYAKEYMEGLIESLSHRADTDSLSVTLEELRSIHQSLKPSTE